MDDKINSSSLLRKSSTLLTVEEMRRAESVAIAAGISSEKLMMAAGEAVFQEITRRWSPRPVSVLCGPGNNGGDGFVVARLLSTAGWPVRLGFWGNQASLPPEAARQAQLWTGPVETLSPQLVAGAELIVDALFGIGLNRRIDNGLANILAVISPKIPVIAVDIPSGVGGDDGLVQGAAGNIAEILTQGLAVKAEVTVTFCRGKPGHYLWPGCALSGEVVVADIGIADDIIQKIAPNIAINDPALWQEQLPRLLENTHKYQRGYAVITAGGTMTGAARLAARAAMRSGAGIVAVACPPETASLYSLALETAVIKPVVTTGDFTKIITDKRVGAILVGPGNGVSQETEDRCLAALSTGHPVIIDADGITALSKNKKPFKNNKINNLLMTPHEGEFAQFFGPMPEAKGSKLARARLAARQSGAIVLLKGPDTVVAHPDGRVVINTNGLPDLATAGSGDVLAGTILGLVAQGMPLFSAACVAIYLQGAAARIYGPGLIASDLPDLLPQVLKNLSFTIN